MFIKYPLVLFIQVSSYTMPSGYKKDGTPRALGKNCNFYIIKSLKRWRKFSGDTTSYISKTIDARNWMRPLYILPQRNPDFVDLAIGTVEE